MPDTSCAWLFAISLAVARALCAFTFFDVRRLRRFHFLRRPSPDVEHAARAEQHHESGVGKASTRKRFRPDRLPPRRDDRVARRALERAGQQRRARRRPGRAGRRKAATNRSVCCAHELGIPQHLDELRFVFRQRVRDAQEAAVLGQQVVEVQRPFLRAGKLRRQQREHRAPQDRAFDHRAGVDADDGRAVIEGVEERRPRRLLRRRVPLPRPDRHGPEIAEVRVHPRVGVERMRAHEHRGIAKRRIAGAPQSLEPAPDERHLDLGAGDERPTIQ